MIISENQIMKLIYCAQDLASHSCYRHTSYGEEIISLIYEIFSQQSQELKVIE